MATLNDATSGWQLIADYSNNPLMGYKIMRAPDGTEKVVQGETFGVDGADGIGNRQSNGSSVYDRNFTIGQSMRDTYDPSGNSTGSYLMKDRGDVDLALFLAAAGGMQFLPGGAFGGAAGGAGAGVTGGVDLGTATGADLSAFYGGTEGAASLGGLGGAGGAAGGAGSAVGAAGGAAGGGGMSSVSGLLQNKGLGLAATALGGLAGAQGNNASTSQTQSMNPALNGYVYDDLLPRTQGLLSAQMPAAFQSGMQMVGAGQGLLAAPVAGNGVGQVKLKAPNTATNPYLSGMADDIQRRVNDATGQSLLGIQGNSVASGGLGGSRQGVAQGQALKGAADSLAGNLANLYGTQYSQDQNRALQQYGMDQSFYGQQRGQDLQAKGLGADLTSAGYGMQWAPIKAATSTYAPFSGFGTTTNSAQSGGGWMGALGGALGAGQLAKNAGWF